MSLTNRSTDLPDGDAPQVFNEVTDDSKITVLVVDDDPDLLDLTATFLERERGEFDILREQGAEDVLARLDGETVDAVVSDYDMPRMNGLDLLDAIREEHEELPFILFTAKGSEEIASEAVSKGVTDYLQKGSDVSQYSLLANRIENAAEQYETTRALKRSQEKFSKLVMNSSDVLAIVNDSGEFEYISPACEQVLGYGQRELVGECAFDYMPVEDRKDAMEEFFSAIENPKTQPIIEFRFRQPDDEYVRLEARGANMFDDDFINGFVVNARDITHLKERERELEQQNERLKDMRTIISHDINDPLHVASDSLVLYGETGEEEYLDKIRRSLDRIDSLIDQVSTMADNETKVDELEQVSLNQTAQDAWGLVDTEAATLHVADSKEFEADTIRIRQVFENLFRNAIEHNDGDVTIYVGTTDSGIYIEDTGTGIPEDTRDRVFESGYTTDTDKTGFGLNIAKQIVVGHGWDIDLSDGEDGGARFEITGISFEPLICD